MKQLSAWMLLLSESSEFARSIIYLCLNSRFNQKNRPVLPTPSGHAQTGYQPLDDFNYTSSGASIIFPKQEELYHNPPVPYRRICKRRNFLCLKERNTPDCRMALAIFVIWEKTGATLTPCILQLRRLTSMGTICAQRLFVMSMTKRLPCGDLPGGR